MIVDLVHVSIHDRLDTNPRKFLIYPSWEVVICALDHNLSFLEGQENDGESLAVDWLSVFGQVDPNLVCLRVLNPLHPVTDLFLNKDRSCFPWGSSPRLLQKFGPISVSSPPPLPKYRITSLMLR